MKFHFNEDNPYPMCCLCGNPRFTMLFFCQDCGEWLCKDTCENNWPLRGIAMAAKAAKHLNERFA